MVAIIQAALCAIIFIMIGLHYRPYPDSRYKLSVITDGLGCMLYHGHAVHELRGPEGPRR